MLNYNEYNPLEITHLKQNPFNQDHKDCKFSLFEFSRETLGYDFRSIFSHSLVTEIPFPNYSKWKAIFDRLQISSISYMSITTLESACVDKPCKNGGTCVPEEDSYLCECREGYSGDNCTGRHYKLQYPKIYIKVDGSIQIDYSVK